LNLALVQAARTLYPDVATIVKTELHRLESFTDDLRRVSKNFRSCYLDKTSLCGQMAFASQRSVLTEEIIEELYDRHLGPGKAEARLAPLFESTSSLVRWRGNNPEEIEENILNFGRKVFENMRSLRAVDLLKQQLRAKHDAAIRVRQLLNEAAPLWTFDAANLGQAFNVQENTFVGMENSDDAEMKNHFLNLNPRTVIEATGDPHAVAVTVLRRGMPLHGLRRMGEFRSHYLNLLKNRNGMLHLDDKMALTRDVMPSIVHQVEMSPETAFTLGLAFGIVKQYEDSGIYYLRFEQGGTICELSADRLDSAILLGANESLLVELGKRIQTLVADQGSTDSSEALQAYLMDGTLHEWEKTCLTRYIELLQA
jgi:hypothetical protein